MSRYIDKDLLVSELECLHENERLKYMGVFDTINSMPEADVAKVKHGKWIVNNNQKDWQSNGYMLHIECSECGKTHFLGTTKYANEYDDAKSRTLDTYDNYSYCARCGAKMDGDKQ